MHLPHPYWRPPVYHPEHSQLSLPSENPDLGKRRMLDLPRLRTPSPPPCPPAPPNTPVPLVKTFEYVRRSTRVRKQTERYGSFISF